MGKPQGQLTALLKESAAGDEAALQRVWSEVYGELQRLARRYMSRESGAQTLQPTALVNETFLKLFQGQKVDFQNRGHFFAIAARAMRQIMVDQARARRAEKRGGPGIKVSFDEKIHIVGAAQESMDLVALDAALVRLGEKDPELVKLVELRYFGGLSLQETAEALGISLATVKRHWTTAKLWLYRELSNP